MQCSLQDTRGWDPRQVELLLADGWQQEVVPMFPATLEEQGYALGAMERARKLRRASDLLRGLLSYVLCVSSFRQLGAWAVLLGLACLSDNGWRKRLRTASAWLGWLVGNLVAAPARQQNSQAARVLLVDATRLRHIGGNGDDWRVHSAYDLLAGRLVEVTVTDQHGAESLVWVSSLRAGDIVVSDNGYGYRKSVALVVQQAADLVTFVTPSTFPVQNRQGERIEVLAWLRQVEGEIASLSCRCQDEQACYQVRLIALRLSQDATQRRQAAKREKAKKAGRAVSEEVLELAGWILVATTLSESSWPAEAVLRLYRARWHIELLFKRINQLLRVVPVRGHTVETVVATIRAVLVAWALQQEEACLLREVLQQVQTRQGEALSCWQELTCPWQLNQESEDEGEKATLDPCEPAAVLSAESATCTTPPPAWVPAVEPEASLSVTGLHPTTSWEAVTADWQPSCEQPHSDRPHPLSHWRLSAICLQTLRQQVQGTWTQARLLACAPLLRRYLLDSPRRRVQLETAVRRWLAPPCPPRSCAQLSAQLIL